ncbi:hypothetical protein [Methylomonas koyamae]|uniref:hypothetical protein n=1 Tax=Methylomonas koyamae TaxID=702114 RepID=UPI0006D18DAB|nr:hypothetical protein [Methylomonas koyamae]
MLGYKGIACTNAGFNPTPAGKMRFVNRYRAWSIAGFAADRQHLLLSLQQVRGRLDAAANVAVIRSDLKIWRLFESVRPLYLGTGVWFYY